MAQSSGDAGSRTGSGHSRAAKAVSIKQGSLFMLCDDDGDVRADSEEGLFFHDMRYLSEEALLLDGEPLISLLSDAGEGYKGIFELTNHALSDKSESGTIRKEGLGVRREKVLGNDYVQRIEIHNYLKQPAKLSLDLTYAADFVDIFVLRGRKQGKRGTLHRPEWQGSQLCFRYDGADGHTRATRLRFSEEPDERQGSGARYHLDLDARASWQLAVTAEVRDEYEGGLKVRPDGGTGASPKDRERARSGALGPKTCVETDGRIFNDILTRSLLDLHMLRMREHDHAFFAAGVPWYVALFGRDSLITSLQMVAFEPQICAATLRVLAGFQGSKVDDYRDEQPGKIPHEFRLGEMADLGEIPQTPYYGSVDSTPLFLIVLGVYVAWSGDFGLFHELRDNVDRALKWIDDYGDSDGDGFIDYETHSSKGLRNQGWKDSGNGIVMEDGSLAEPPIAMPEVQGDVYHAWLTTADLFDRAGERQRAEELRRRAQRLYQAFNDQFWLEDLQYYALCRDGTGRFSRSVASNPAHGLWTGIVDPSRARAVAERVLKPDMFSGWGIRTLSGEDRSYDPVAYQLGSVWPYDNSMIVAGLRRYGLLDELSRVFRSLVEAAAEFDHYRLPEVFAGYDRSRASRPVKYPVACNPQAWASGSIPQMLMAALGAEADAISHRLRVRQPRLPDFLRRVDVRRLPVGDATVDLHFERSDGRTQVTVTGKTGEVSVDVDE